MLRHVGLEVIVAYSEEQGWIIYAEHPRKVRHPHDAPVPAQEDVGGKWW